MDLQLPPEPDLRLLIRMYEGGIDPEEAARPKPAAFPDPTVLG
ncbi:hypothetical protein [Thiocapsa sp.]